MVEGAGVGKVQALAGCIGEVIAGGIGLAFSPRDGSEIGGA